MQCPYCKSTDSEVVETRVSEDGANIRRRRNCLACGKRYPTYERIEHITLIVKKKDGRREQFDREKLRQGLMKACEKTTVSLDAINNIVDEVERELISGESVEIERSEERRVGKECRSRW